MESIDLRALLLCIVEREPLRATLAEYPNLSQDQVRGALRRVALAMPESQPLPVDSPHLRRRVEVVGEAVSEGLRRRSKAELAALVDDNAAPGAAHDEAQPAAGTKASLQSLSPTAPATPKATRPLAAQTLVVYSDGACRGNPGPSAAGWVICEPTGRQIGKGGFFLGKRTNNEAEYAAAIMGLKAASEMGATHVTLRADSELMVRQLQGRYQVKNARLLPLFRELKALGSSFNKFTAQHVPREQNAAADEQANLAIDRHR